MIELQQVSKFFQREKKAFQALDNISLTIDKGDIFGIIGYSGAGKSTLVRCINLLERPTTGKVWIDGVDVTGYKGRELRQLRQKIGMIFQHFNLMPSRTVFENIALPLEATNLSDKAIEERVLSLLDLVELSDLATVYPSQLSGGQKQRVAIARALANNPDILLCDEATSALDPKTTEAILKLLRTINDTLGITIVLITHEMDVVKAICHHVAVLEKGRLLESGDIFTVFANPQKDQTKQYLATSSNISKIDWILENPDLPNLLNGGVLVRLTYLKKDVSLPLISQLSERFHVAFNILLADIAFIDGSQIGGTVVIFNGNPADIANAITYLEERTIKVEVIRDDRRS